MTNSDFTMLVLKLAQVTHVKAVRNEEGKLALSCVDIGKASSIAANIMADKDIASTMTRADMDVITTQSYGIDINEEKE